MDKISDNNSYLNRSKKILLIVAGTFFIGIGIIGIFIPILPTTPFILIAATIYVRSSKNFYSWLVNNKIFGKYIRNYREGKGIPLIIKILTVAFLWITIGCSTFFVRHWFSGLTRLQLHPGFHYVP